MFFVVIGKNQAMILLFRAKLIPKRLEILAIHINYCIKNDYISEFKSLSQLTGTGQMTYNHNI